MNKIEQATERRQQIEIITHTIFDGTPLPGACKAIKKDKKEAPNPSDFAPSSPNSAIPFTRSGLDSKDKFTVGARRCFIVAILGERQGQNMSEIFHIQPGLFLNSPSGNTFRINYQDKLSFYQAFLKEGSISSLIAGSSTHPDDRIDDLDEKSKFPIAAEWLDSVHKKHLGVDSIVLSPRNHSGLTDLFVATQQRKAYLINHVAKP